MGCRFVHIFRAFQAGRRELVSPREGKRRREKRDQQEDEDTDRLVRHREVRGDLGGDLDEQPTDDRVGDGYAVNMAAFQLAEKIAQVHRAFP